MARIVFFSQPTDGALMAQFWSEDFDVSMQIVVQYALTFGAQCCRAYKAQIFAKKMMQSNSVLIGLEFICV